MTLADRIVAEARTWLGTPFRWGAQRLGAGVDCGMLVLAVYQAVGVVPTPVPGGIAPYARNWFLHRNDQRFEQVVREYFVLQPIDATPAAGDLVLWQVARAYAHGTIVVAWPLVIHADPEDHTVLEADATQAEFARRARQVWRPHGV